MLFRHQMSRHSNGLGPARLSESQLLKLALEICTKGCVKITRRERYLAGELFGFPRWLFLSNLGAQIYSVVMDQLKVAIVKAVLYCGIVDGRVAYLRLSKRSAAENYLLPHSLDKTAVT